MKKICFVTGSRAEYGLLRPIIDRVKASKDLRYQIIALGMHMSPAFGKTIDYIYEDGFEVTKQIETLLSSDTSVGMGKTFGIGSISLADAFEEIKPDLVVLLGDRYEALMAACIASIARIPIAHIHGGELTYGAIDDSFRHAITKLSHIHFTSTEEYRNRVIQMGEQPHRVWNVGAVGLDNIREMRLLNNKDIRNELGLPALSTIILVTYHPETLIGKKTLKDCDEVLIALDRMANDYTIVFTGSNCDANGIELNTRMKEYVARNERRYYFSNLGSVNYLSLLKTSRVVVGNSSSGILEAPFLGIPTINIGGRQRGRIRPSSVIDCGANSTEIYSNIMGVISGSIVLSIEDNPYYKGCASDSILNGLRGFFHDEVDVGVKEFYDLI